MDANNFTVSPTSLVFLSLTLFSVLTLYVTYKARTALLFDRILVFASGYMLLHSAYVFTVAVFFDAMGWKDRLMPFELMYGPLIFFAIASVKNKDLPFATVFIHSVPFFLFLIIFGLFHAELIPAESSYLSRAKRFLSYAMSLSFIGYSVWTFSVNKKVIFQQHRQRILPLVLCQVLLLFVAMLSIAPIFIDRLDENPESAIFGRLLIYIALILAELIIFNYSFGKLVRSFEGVSEPEVSLVQPDVFELPKYERSSLTVAQLSAYEKQLHEIMAKKRLYLQKELSLTTLAQNLKMPAHHLTQVLSIRLQMTFYQYINSLRINHACELLKDKTVSLTLEELAEESGFNSKVSFNRQFKQAMHTTPSAYRRIFST